MSDDVFEAGDIIRDTFPEKLDDYLDLYLGNGRFGACVDRWGLMNNGARGRAKASPGNTVFMHADHWHRGAWGLDYWLPLARLIFAGDEPPRPKMYSQELRIVHGYAHTEIDWSDLSLTIVSYFHPTRRDLFAFHLSYEVQGKGAMPALLLAPETDIRTHYDQHLTGAGETIANDSDFWLARVKAGTAASALGLRVMSNDGRATLNPGNDGCEIQFSGRSGRHLLLISAAGASREAELVAEMKNVASAADLLDESIEGWHARWGDAEISVPDENYQALFERSHYYVLASSAPEVRSPPAPMGWSGNGWPFHFPQDVSYIHPALLRLGHFDIAKAWVEFYRGALENMQSATARIYKAKGAMWAWEFPIGPNTEFLKDGTPNWFQFEIHNAAYPARMAREASHCLRDPKWSAEIAWPVVRESARFFASILQKETDGSWGIHVVPSMGQDEMGGKDAKNYLCALFSAQYALQSALAMGRELGLSEPDFEQWSAVLRDGLAFKRLVGPNGMYVTCEGLLGAEQLGRQKHPVQLNPLTFLPLGKEFDDAPLHAAYSAREELCAGVKDKFYHGWTLAAYWLAASHNRDAAGLQRELSNALPARHVDADWIQIYETSGAKHAPYYVTSHGLYLQAMSDALISDFWGATELGAAKIWPEATYTNLRLRDGTVASSPALD